MKTIYIYLLATLADWELGHVIAELNSRRFFKENAPALTVKTVSYSKKPIKTMGGLTIVPDCTVDELLVREENVLLLPGADTWNEPEHQKIIQKASEFLDLGATVAAICGATMALANAGLLDQRPHTSNDLEFLQLVCPTYQGQAFYQTAPVVADHNLITANPTASLLWAKEILAELAVFSEETLAAWYNYFSTGEAADFFALMATLPANQNKKA